MRNHMHQFIAIVRLTAVEALRQPICLLLAITCIVATAIVPITAMHNFGEEGKLTRDSALAFHFIFGIFITVYSAVLTFNREIQKGTVLAILSKPVGREIFYLSKFAGIVLVVVVFSFIATISTLIADRSSEVFITKNYYIGYVMDWRSGIFLCFSPAIACIIGGIMNYARKNIFTSTSLFSLFCLVLLIFVYTLFFDRLGRFAPEENGIQTRIIPVSLLITLALIVIASIAVTLAIRCGITTSLVFSLAIFAAGLLSDYFLTNPAWNTKIFKFFFVAFIPNWQHFWMADALDGGQCISLSYVLFCLVYALFYLSFILSAGIIIFKHTDIK